MMELLPALDKEASYLGQHNELNIDTIRSMNSPPPKIWSATSAIVRYPTSISDNRPTQSTHYINSLVDGKLERNACYSVKLANPESTASSDFFISISIKSYSGLRLIWDSRKVKQSGETSANRAKKDYTW